MLRNNSIVHSFYISQKRENNVLWEVIVTNLQHKGSLSRNTSIGDEVVFHIWKIYDYVLFPATYFLYISAEYGTLLTSRSLHMEKYRCWMNCWPVNVCTNGASWASKLPLENWQISWVELVTLIWEVGTSYQSILQMTLKFNFYVIV